MSPPETASAATRARRGASWSYLAVAGATLVALGIWFMFRNQDWHTVYLPAARALWRGQDIYADFAKLAYTYPPSMAFLALPVAFLPTLAARAIWYLVNAAAIVALWSAAWRLTGGARLTVGVEPAQRPRMRRERWVLFLGTFCAARFAIDCLDHQQTDLLVAALVVVGCALVATGADIKGAITIGLAAGLKATPIIWVLFFLLRRKWLAAITVVIVALALNLAPNLVSRPPGGGLWLTGWVQTAVAPLADTGHGLGHWFTAPGYNQSLTGTLHRLQTCQVIRTNDGLVEVPRLQPLVSAQAERLVVLIGQGLLLAGTVLGLVWRQRRSAIAGADRTVFALRCGLLLMAMVLLSPASSKPHFVVTLLPALVLAHLALSEKSRWAAATLAGAIILIFVSNRQIVGEGVGYPVFWIGGVTWSALLLWIGCFAGIAQRRGDAMP
jgi:alpha-1,2-mannosyltransferase